MIPIEGFGCSDCRSCVSHLYSFEGRPLLADFRRQVRIAVPGHGLVDRAAGHDLERLTGNWHSIGKNVP